MKIFKYFHKFQKILLLNSDFFGDIHGVAFLQLFSNSCYHRSMSLTAVSEQPSQTTCTDGD